MLNRIPPPVAALEARAARSASPGRGASPPRAPPADPNAEPGTPSAAPAATPRPITATAASGVGNPNEDPAVSEAWWAESLHLLADFHFLDMLVGYDKDGMTDQVAVRVATFVADPRFDPVAMQRVSLAAAALCKWVKAMDMFQKGRKVSTQRVWEGLGSPDFPLRVLCTAAGTSVGPRSGGCSSWGSLCLTATAASCSLLPSIHHSWWSPASAPCVRPRSGCSSTRTSWPPTGRPSPP